MKFLFNFIFITLVLFTVNGCNTENYLTKEEIDNQNQASLAITNTLFDNNIDETATYRISNSGHVDISFDKSVSEATYTKTVNQLRSNLLIKSVWATQGGVEVCPLR